MLLLWLPVALATLLIPFAVVAALVLVLFRVSDSAAWKLWVGVPFGCAFAPAILLVLLLGGASLWNAVRPASSAFAEVFPDEPGELALRASTSAGLDSRSVLLELRREEQWLADATDYYGFRPLSPASAFVWSIGQEAPSWAQIVRDPAQCPPARQWHRESMDDWDNVVLVDCPRAGRLFLLASNID